MKRLLTGGAGVALATISTAAFAQTSGGPVVRYSNTINTSLSNSASSSSNTSLSGNVTISGNVEVDSAATAISDSKQIVAGNTVVIVDEDDGASTARADNYVGPFAVDAAGNVGVNIAAGYNNVQANMATLGIASGLGSGADDGGWSKASATALQSLSGTTHISEPGTRSTNLALIGEVSGSGNIGVNVAAGAFNVQQNIMTLAVATNSSLAEASAAVVQVSTGNRVVVAATDNHIDPRVSGNGNFGVNVAMGVGNLQNNSLTGAVSGAFGGNGTGGGGAGGS